MTQKMNLKKEEAVKTNKTLGSGDFSPTESSNY